MMGRSCLREVDRGRERGEIQKPARRKNFASKGETEQRPTIAMVAFGTAQNTRPRLKNLLLNGKRKNEKTTRIAQIGGEKGWRKKAGRATP